MRKPVILLIDTAFEKSSSVSLLREGRKRTIQAISDKDKAQQILPLIVRLLKDEGVSLSDITEIKVNINYESFTGLRVAVAVANTLAFLLKIPINGKRPPFIPNYKK